MTTLPQVNSLKLLVPTLFFLLFFLGACSSAPRVNPEVTTRRNRAVELTQYGNNYFAQGDFQQALSFFQLALDLNLLVDHWEGISRSYHSIARTLIAMESWDQADTLLLEALDFAQLADDSRSAMLSRISQGEILLYRGESQEALDLFTRLLNQVTEPDWQTERALIHHARGTAHRNLGLQFRTEGNENQALASLRRAEEDLLLARGINQELQALGREAENLSLLASVKSLAGEYPAALAYSQEALELNRRIENSRGLAMDYRALGLISLRNSDADNASRYFQRALRIYQAMGHQEGTVSTLILLRDQALAENWTSRAQRYEALLAQVQPASNDSN